MAKRRNQPSLRCLTELIKAVDACRRFDDKTIDFLVQAYRERETNLRGADDPYLGMALNMINPHYIRALVRTKKFRTYTEELAGESYLTSSERGWRNKKMKITVRSNLDLG